MEKIFFQSSLPRSGSTILQNVMFQNPEFYCTPTSGVLELLYGARENYSNSPEFVAQDAALMKSGFLAFCKHGLHAYYEAITDKKYVLDKSRGWGIHHDFLKQVLEEQPKIICVVRDLRDVFCSMEKNFRKHPDKANSVLNWAEMKGITTPQRIDIWAAQQPVGLAISRLSEIMRQGIDSKMLFVKYEDLCLYPQTEMQRIYQYLEVPYYEHDFDNIEQLTKEDDEVYGVFGDHQIRQNLKLTTSTARQVLGKEVCEWIFTNYKWYFDYFRYTK